jgi:hypothetical protein
MDISRYSHNGVAVTRRFVDLLYISSGIFMTPWIGMTLGMERTGKQKIAGLRMTSDRHSNFDRVKEKDRSNVLDGHFGMH